MDTYTFEEMTEQHLDEILQIEEKSFSLPWKRDMFEQDLKNKFAYYLMIKAGTKIIGYCGAWIVFEDAQITNIAILPEYRGKKLGEALLKEVIFRLKEKQVEMISLEVRLSNTIAHGLYGKLGFQKGGIRKGYYQDNHEDAQVMWVKINE